METLRTTLEIAKELAAAHRARRPARRKTPTPITSAELLRITNQVQDRLNGYCSQISALIDIEPGIQDHYREVCKNISYAPPETADQLAQPNNPGSKEMRDLTDRRVKAGIAKRLNEIIQADIETLKQSSHNVDVAAKPNSSQADDLPGYQRSLAAKILEINEKLTTQLNGNLNTLGVNRAPLLDARQIFALRTLVPLKR